MSLNSTIERALGCRLRNGVDGLDGGGLSSAFAYARKHPFKLGVHQVLVGLGGARLVVGMEAAVKQAQAHCVALALKQLNQGGRRVGGKLDLVHPRLRRDVGGVVHRARGVDHNLATQVGLFLVAS